MTNEVLTEVRGRIMVITINRPDAMNAINTAVSQGIGAAFEQLDRDPRLTAGILTGAGKGFCSGMDLKAFATDGPPEGMSALVEKGCNKPLVAAVEGFALAGGLELALICDLIVAAEGIKFGIPEVKVGLFAAGGGLLHLPRRLPYGIAMEMALTGNPITSEEGYRYGFINRLAPPGKALDVALELAGAVTAGAPLAVVASKRLVRAAVDLDEAEFWKFQRPHLRVFRSEDAKEGSRAFAKKRAPVWSGR